jgi:hypothetical protein
VKFHGFIVGVVLAVMAGSAWGGTQCLLDTEKGPYTCNCSDHEVQYQTCSNSTVKVTSGHQTGISWTFPGLTATASASYSEEASTGDSECITATLAPHSCAWWEYSFLVCITPELVEGFWGDKIVQHVTVAYLGKAFVSKPAPPGACP